MAYIFQSVFASEFKNFRNYSEPPLFKDEIRMT